MFQQRGKIDKKIEAQVALVDPFSSCLECYFLVIARHFIYVNSPPKPECLCL